MKIKNSLIVLFLIVCPLILHAQNSPSWKKWNLQLLEKNEKAFKLKDEKNRVFFIEKNQNFKAQKVKNVVQLKNEFFAMKILKIKKLYFIVNSKEIRAFILPKQLTIAQKQLLQHIPGGLNFVLQGKSLLYSFKVLKGMTVFKMQGRYIDEKIFAKKLFSAIQDPSAYIRKNNPDYFLAKLEEHQRKLEELELKHLSLKKYLQYIRYAVISFHNTGFLSGPKPLSKGIIKRILLLKGKYPTWKAEKIVSYLEEKEKQDVSEKQVWLVLNLYFNEFEE